MGVLHANTKSLLDSGHADGNYLSAADKHVVVIGGGDTGTDCVGTSMRHQCKNLVQFEILPRPRYPASLTILARVATHLPPRLRPGRGAGTLWRRSAYVPDRNGKICRGSARHVKELHTINIAWGKDERGRFVPQRLPGGEKVWPADLVLLAMGFLGPEETILEQLGVERDDRSECQSRVRPLRHEQARGLCCRGYAARSEPGGLGLSTKDAALPENATVISWA